ncbi:MAG: Hpt domain-containing protein [Chloroherpetonaceae bacterium]|nr:Hpt domain-containing protein [Chloroherpetonaceae bacterium]MDW8438253.1 Hpt domain-containing protein [Chloroherpetonaceae bacterium]
MMGSGILLGGFKSKKKPSKSAANATLTPETQANATIKLFLEDVSSRLKSLLKKHKGKNAKTFLSFFSRLAAEPNPIETLSKLQLAAFSDFLAFLENAKTKLLSADAERSSHVYRSLTENLDSTAEFLSQLLPTLEKDVSTLNALSRYVSGAAFQPSPPVVRAVQPQPSLKPVAQVDRSNGDGQPFYKGKRRLYYYAPSAKSDFGLDLTQLARLFPAADLDASFKTRSTKTSPAPTISPALRAYFKQIAAFAREIVSEKAYSQSVSDALEKIASSPDPFSDFHRFSSLPGISDFLDFSKTLNENAINGLGEALIKDIARHLCDTFALPEATELISSYLSSSIESEVDSAIESIVTGEPPKEEPLPQMPIEKIVAELESETSSAAPTEADYVQFVSDTLRKAHLALETMNASKAARNHLLDLLSQPDVLVAIDKSELAFLRNFADFLRQSWVNQTPASALLAHQDEIVGAMTQALQDAFPADAPAPIEPLEAEKALNELESHIAPVSTEEERIPELPDLSEFISEVASAVPGENENADASPASETVSPAPESKASETTSPLPDISEFVVSESVAPAETESVSSFDYAAAAANFLRQVILALPNSSAGVAAQTYLQSLLDAPDLLYALATSSHRGLTELAATLERAKLSQTPVANLAAPLAEAVGMVAGELLQRFRAESSPAETDEEAVFTFSELVPPSAFSNATTELDDVFTLSESESSFVAKPETLTSEIQMPDIAQTSPESSSSASVPAGESSNAPSAEPTLDELNAIDDSLLLDDSNVVLSEEPSAPSLDDLKLDAPQTETDLDVASDALLLPDDEPLSEAPTQTAQTSVEDVASPTLADLPELDFSATELTMEDSSTPDASSQPTAEASLSDAPAFSEAFSAESPFEQSAAQELSLDASGSLNAETSLELASEAQPATLEPSASVAPTQADELVFQDELLLDESAIGEIADETSPRQDFSDLSSLSAKAAAQDSEELSFSDTLDESLFSDSPTLLEDAPSAEPASPIVDSPILEQPVSQTEISEPSLELPDLNFGEVLLDDAVAESPSSQLSSLESATKANSELPELSFDDSLALDDSLASSDSPETLSEVRSETPLQAEAKPEPAPSLPSLHDVSYESELAPINEDFRLDELQQIFLDEAKEYLEKLNGDMLELDKFAGTQQPELVNRVLRGAHTLKGSAAMVNLKNIRDLAHKMEDCLQVVRDNNLKVPRPLLDVCFKALDAISVMVENFRRTGEDRFTKAQPLMDLFVSYTKQLQDAGEIKDSTASLSAPSAPAAQEVAGDFQPDELQQIFLDEAKEYLDKLSEDLLELDKFVGTVQPELVNRAMRGAHTLKGSAAMVNLKNISELAHKMEDCLQVARDNNLKVSRPLMDILLKSSDAIGEMLKKFRATGKDDLDVSRHVFILKDYTTQLQQTGEIKNVIPFEAPAPAESAPAQKPKSGFAEETVRIDIRSLNNLVNMSAELVISRNRLTNELASVTRLINKFMKERNHLAQINKKILTTIQKNAGERADSSGGFSDILKEFSESEFDRFSDLDIISRDVRSAMLNLDETINELRALSAALGQNVVKVSGIANDLNREIVGMRMVPMKQMYSRFHRSVRDIAQKEGKELVFNTEGEDTKLDKSVMEEVVEPVMHMVRNAIGHGIETPDVRRARGKPPAGNLTIRAYQKGSRIILEIEDDGGGIPIEKVKAKAVRLGLITPEEAATMPPSKATELIFLPGFSTADKITELSGRGVGMDVVKNTIRQLKGTVNVETREGKGTKFTISLPITLAINQALLVRASEYTYAIPLELVLETLMASTDYLTTDEEGKRYISIRGEEMEFRYLNELLGYSIAPLEYKTLVPVVVIGLEDRKVAVAVESLKGKEEIVVKSLGRHLRNVRGIIGATILGDGQVVVILDMEHLLRPAEERGEDVHIQAIPAPEPQPEDIQPTITKRKRKGAKITVLHADDSPSVRKYVQSILKAANIEVISADDGLNALNRLTQPNANIDLIVSDLEMPRMNGFEFVTEVRKMEAYKDIPFIIVTARAGDKHRRTGLELGANAFLNKPFDPAQLIETIESYIA